MHHILLPLLVAGKLYAVDAPVPAPAPAADAPPLFVDEAPRVAGWALPSAPGTISDEQLPAYRCVEGPGFFPLLAHITVGGIAMTAPVTMGVPDAQPRGFADTMRFVYPTVETPPGPLPDGLRLVDVPAQRVLRLAHRGRLEQGQPAAMVQRLRDAAAAGGLAATGEPVFCGWNSPSVPAAARTWEVMLPVATVDARPTPQAQP